MMRSATREITIAFWEYPVLIIYIIIVGVLFSRRKNIEMRRHPEYRFYLLGLYAKILGGFAFTMIYMFYYKAGDVFSYFASTKALANLAARDPVRYVQALFGENSWTNFYTYFDAYTGFPVNYIYTDDRTYLLVKMVSPLTLIGLNSFVLTTALVSTVTYDAVWRMYRTLVRYYPSLQNKLAFAVLFFPSTLFWGSGIVKDTFTFSGVCYYVYALDRIFFQRERGFGSWLALFVGSLLMVLLKPYVFMMLFPASMFWVLYHRVQRIRNAVVRVLLLPVGGLGLLALTLNILQRLEDRLGKFSMDRALDTIVTAQTDMKRSEQYGTNFFDLGNIAPTWDSVLSKFPQAVFAGLFRPLLVEVNNVTMLLSAAENTFLLLMVAIILLRTRVVLLISLLLKNPLLQMSFLFAIGYAFMIAITTPNFGAMVRFKIPLLPLFVAALFITQFILDKRSAALRAGRRFRFEVFTDGEPLPGKEGEELPRSAASAKGGDRPRYAAAAR